MAMKRTQWMSLATLFSGFFVLTNCNPTESNPADGGANDANPDAQIALPACGATGSGTYVVSVSPKDGEQRTLRLPMIVIKTSAEVQCPTAPPSLTATSGTVPTTSDCTKPTKILTLVPKQDLAYLTSYTLRLEGLMDAQGKAVPACQVTFQTKSKTAAISTQGAASFARDEDGTLWIWADPINATRTNRTNDDLSVPEKVDLGGKKIVAMSMGNGFGVAATEDGALWTWGNNLRGQLGRSTKATPHQPPGKAMLTLPANVTIVSVAAGVDHALLARSDGKVMAWGRNDSRELGDGTTAEQLAPHEVPGLTDVIAVSAGTGSSGKGVIEGGWSLALKSDGTVWGFGSNAFSALSLPILQDPTYGTPTQLPLQNVKAIAAGYDQGYALLKDGTVRAWGESFDGGLGNDTCQDGPLATPASVLGASGALDNVVAVSAGHQYGVAARTDGTLWGWGNDSSGQLGDGTKGKDYQCNPNFTATGIQKKPIAIAGVTDALSVAADETMTLVLLRDGTVLGAGYNPNNQIGVGGKDTYVLTFKKVPGL